MLQNFNNFIAFGYDNDTLKAVSSGQEIPYSCICLALVHFESPEVNDDIARLLVSITQVILNSFLTITFRAFNLPLYAFNFYVGRFVCLRA
jgi:hypothetical protein